LIYNSQENSPLLNGYYHGGDRFFRQAFVEIKDDSIIVSLILFDRYPRKLLNDVLLYNSNTQTWKGVNSILYKRQDKFFLRVTDSLSVFYSKEKDIKIKSDEQYYKRYVDEYRNIAVLHECFNAYLEKGTNKADRNRKFNELRKKYNLDKLRKHSDFLKSLEEFKIELFKDNN
jgi:hypothetical protein